MKESFDNILKAPKYSKLLPYLVLAVLLAFSVLAWQFYENTVLEREERRYNEYVDSVIKEITARLHNYEMILKGGAGVFAASEEVTRDEWRAYYEHQQISALYPGIQGATFSRVVQPPELAQHIEGIRSEGFPDYTVWPEGERGVYTPVIFLEPFDERNRRAFGYDVFSEPVRRDAMERARDTGATAITAMVMLVTEIDRDSQSGFLMFVPAYAQGMPLNSPEERSEAIEGYVAGAFRMHDLMQGIFPDSLDKIGFQIYDGAEISVDTLLYDSHVSPDVDNAERQPLFANQKTLDLYGYQWTLAFETMPAFEAAVDRYTPGGILVAGLLFSFLIFLYLRAQVTTGDRALSLAQKMTSALRESEQKYRHMTENITDIIWSVDLEGRPTYISPAIETLIGFTPEEVMAMPITDYIIQEDSDALMTKLTEELVKPPVERDRSVFMPARHRTKDDRIVHAEISASWLLDEQGNLIGVQGTTRDITERVQAENEMYRQFNRAKSLLHLASRLNANLELKTLLHVICEETCAALHVPLSAFLFYDSKSRTFQLADSLGLPPEFTELVEPLPRAVYDELVQKLGKSSVIPDLATMPDIPYAELMQEFGIKSFAYAALERDDFPVGFLAAGAAGEELVLTEDAPELLSGLADQATSAVANAELFQKLKSANVELLQAYDATIEGWAYALDLKDEETENHSQRVAEVTLRLARKMGIKEEDLIHVRRGALLHDIGKMGIPDEILLKPGKLTDEEWEIMRRHPRFAYEMLSPIDYLRPALAIPYSHQEKWDGSGYPHGLKGEQIPLTARIFAVVDVFDALTSDRPYRKAWSRQEAIDYIQKESGKHFDPQVVKVFLSSLDEWSHL